MNDFTKDELCIIYNFFERHKQDSYDDCRYSGLLNKIQSLIENYCEHEECQHESDGKYYLRTEKTILQSEYLDGELNFNNSEYKCKKCGEFYK